MTDLEKSFGVERPEHSSPTLNGPKGLLTAAADDEAAKIIAQYDGPTTWTTDEERRLRRRVDWKLMPILCFTYFMQYYDKAMLGQAALFGLTSELDLAKGNRYSFSAAIFYLGFIAGSYPAILLAQRFPIERVASGITTIWGVCLLLTITCSNFQGLYTQRFFLGFLESGISPMFMMIVGSWYKKDEQAFRMGMWYSLTGFASVVSPLINYGLGHVHATLTPYKYMYIFAGCVTTVWGLLLLILLPPDPIRARGFGARERYILVARLRTNNSGVRNTHFKKAQATELLCDIKFWLVFLIALLSMIANGPISTFIPIIIHGFGYNTLDSLLLLMPAGAYNASMMLLMGFLAYKFSHRNIRTWIVFGTQCCTVLAAALLWRLPRSSKGGLFFAIYILSTYGAGYSILMGLCMANTAGYTKRSLTSSGLYVGYCLGNFIGPLIFLEKESPIYDTGFTVTTITAAIAAVLALCYRVVCWRDNKQREASGTIEAFDHAFDDPTDKTNKQFRYVL